jgi:hypothetical protein
VNADVRDRVDRSQWNQPVDARGILGLPIKRIDTRERGAGDRDRHRMLTGVARLEMHRIMILIRVVMRGGSRMLVRSRSVLVLWMIVIGVGVRVQRGHLGRGAHEGKAGHDGDETLHTASVWKHQAAVKRQVF